MKEKDLDQLIVELLSYHSPAELKGFLRAILTPQELREIPTRLMIVKLLKQGVPQREIASRLRVGIATVTRGSRELAKGNFRNVA